MPDMLNRRWLLANRPGGWPSPSDFKLDEVPVPAPGPGQVVLRTLYLSVDPYMRGRMRDVKSYAPPVGIGEVMVGGAVCRVEQSNNPAFNVGDIVEGRTGWQTWAVSDGSDLRKVDPTLAPISTALGTLGMPGLTAYFGLLDVCAAQPGETVAVSGAAGAVGHVVGQIARIKGCRAVGIAGTDEKCAWLTDDLGFDAAINYKTAGDLGKALEGACPEGIDCYFDNVGGPVTDAVLPRMNLRGRIGICGQISQYNLEQPEVGPRPFWMFIRLRLRAEGFLVFDFADRHEAALQEMGAWVRDGRLRYRETMVAGFERTPEAFIDMMRGENIGKMVIQVADA